jgi:ParB-like chromosome segregation protein Spo0J
LKIKISEIIVGERRRTEVGNIKELADSIKKFGLLHPIVVDDHKRLVAGGRRLAACKLLGWEEVEVTLLKYLPEQQLRAIELEENLRRKDLTEYEKSRNMVQLAEIKAEIQKEETKEFRPQDNLKNGNNQLEGFYEERKNLGGRPSKEGISEAKIAEAIGVPLNTLRDAKAHVQAVEQYPELEELPKKEAIQTAKYLNKVPEEHRKPVLDAIKERPEEHVSLTEKVNRMPDSRLYKVFYKFSVLVTSVTEWGDMETVVQKSTYNELREISHEFEYMLEKMTSWKTVIDQEIKTQTNIRRVK